MQIKTIQNPSLEEYIPIIKILNKVFSAFPNHTGYTPEIAFEKMKSESDVVTYLAIDNENIIGFAMCYARYEGYFHLWQMGVEEAYRGKGIASQLYDTVETHAKQNGYKGISVNTSNIYPTQIRLLIKRGYQIYDLDKSGEFEQNPKILFRLTF